MLASIYMRVSSSMNTRKIVCKEKFYGVRVAVADLLSKAPSRWSAEILRLLLTSEKDPKALHLIAEVRP